ncbi:hypothetical protein MBLNU230_g2321t1 [Neophaeotheca triangularis]
MADEQGLPHGASTSNKVHVSELTEVGISDITSSLASTFVTKVTSSITKPTNQFERLPDELVCDIFEVLLHSERLGLQSAMIPLAKVSKRFNRISTPLLYETFSSRQAKDESIYQFSPQPIIRPFLLTLARHPRLAAKVKNFLFYPLPYTLEASKIPEGQELDLLLNTVKLVKPKIVRDAIRVGLERASTNATSCTSQPACQDGSRYSRLDEIEMKGPVFFASFPDDPADEMVSLSSSLIRLPSVKTFTGESMAAWNFEARETAEQVRVLYAPLAQSAGNSLSTLVLHEGYLDGDHAACIIGSCSGLRKIIIHWHYLRLDFLSQPYGDTGFTFGPYGSEYELYVMWHELCQALHQHAPTLQRLKLLNRTEYDITSSCPLGWFANLTALEHFTIDSMMLSDSMVEGEAGFKSLKKLELESLEKSNGEKIEAVMQNLKENLHFFANLDFGALELLVIHFGYYKVANEHSLPPWTLFHEEGDCTRNSHLKWGRREGDMEAWRGTFRLEFAGPGINESLAWAADNLGENKKWQDIEEILARVLVA